MSAQAIYRGFTLRASREPSLGGDELLYFQVWREEDGWVLTEDFTSGDETEEKMVEILRGYVDDYYEKPEDYEDE